MNNRQPKEIPVAGLLKRGSAAFVDYFLLLLPLTGYFCLTMFGVPSAAVRAGVALPFAWLLFVILYFVGQWTIYGCTLGQRAMQLRVVNAQGRIPTLGQALLRLLGYLINSILLWVGFAWIPFDARRQGWHDKIAGTYVISSDSDTDDPPFTYSPSEARDAADISLIITFYAVLVFGGLCLGLLSLFLGG